MRWGAGIAAVALLAAGGAAAGLKLTSSTPANAAQAVALNAALNNPKQDCPAPTGTHAGAGRTGAHAGARGTGAHASASGNSASGNGASGVGAAHKGCLRRRLREIRGMYGQVAFHTSGGTQTLAFERGAVDSLSGSRLTVRAANGTQWTWTLASTSKIHEKGRTIPASRLTKGTPVFVGGQVAGSSRNARLVFVHPAGMSPGSGGHRSFGGGSSGGSASGGDSSGGGSSGGSATGSGS